MKKGALILATLVLLVAIGAVVTMNSGGAGIAAAALEEKYVSPHDRFVNVAGARVRIREEGDAASPPILLIHGFSHSLETWDSWAAYLKRDFRVIRYDLLGHGLTGPDEQRRYAPEERAAFIGEILQTLDLGEVIIAGNSLGGLAAWRFAETNPAQIRALILISPGAYPLNGAGDEPADIPAVMKAYLKTVPEIGVRASAELIYADDTKITDARLEVMRDMMRRRGNGEAMINSLEEFTLPEPTGALSRIMTPTLILWGEEDSIIPIEQGRQMQETMPNARLIAYRGVGHAVQEEVPKQSVIDAMIFIKPFLAMSESTH